MYGTQAIGGQWPGSMGGVLGRRGLDRRAAAWPSVLAGVVGEKWSVSESMSHNIGLVY